MRSRYCAYVRGDVPYLMRTVEDQRRGDHDPAAIAAWSQTAEWLGLTVHRTIAGGPDHALGLVEFTARWRQAGQERSLREHSVFVRNDDGRWCYRDGGGDALLPGRKSPCLCGSGQPFKRCCG